VPRPFLRGNSDKVGWKVREMLSRLFSYKDEFQRNIVDSNTTKAGREGQLVIGMPESRAWPPLTASSPWEIGYEATENVGLVFFVRSLRFIGGTHSFTLVHHVTFQL
jgi:hypothetical protein